MVLHLLSWTFEPKFTNNTPFMLLFLLLQKYLKLTFFKIVLNYFIYCLIYKINGLCHT
jgi:hypothetical protein